MTRPTALLLACVCLMTACNRQSSQSLLPSQPPNTWSLSIAVRGTTDRPSGEPHRAVFFTVSGSNVSMSARRSTPLSQEAKSEHVNVDIAPPIARSLYQLTRAAFATHSVGMQPSTPVEDGTSLLIELRSYDKGVQLGYHHSAIAMPEVLALLAQVDSHLPERFQIQWVKMQSGAESAGGAASE